MLYKIPPIKIEGRNYSNNNTKLSYRSNSNNTNHSIKSYRDKSKNYYGVYSRNKNHNNLAQIKTMNLIPRFTPFKNHYHYNSQINLENKQTALRVIVPIVNDNNRMNSQKSMIDTKHSRNVNIMQKTNSLITNDIFRHTSMFYKKKKKLNRTLLNVNINKNFYH